MKRNNTYANILVELYSIIINPCLEIILSLLRSQNFLLKMNIRILKRFILFWLSVMICFGAIMDVIGFVRDVLKVMTVSELMIPENGNYGDSLIMIAASNSAFFRGAKADFKELFLTI